MNSEFPTESDDIFLSSRIKLLMKLRTSGITDTKLLSAIEEVPREEFVPRMFHDKAYDDVALPIESGQTISQPSIVALMTAKLELKGRERVLEVGTGSGYQAMILSKMVRRVYTIERYSCLLDIAKERFERFGVNNITSRLGDGTKGWADIESFDRIMVTAAASEVPEGLLEQLSVGGIMIIPIGSPAGEQDLLRIKRSEDGYESESIIKVRFVPLIEGSLPESI